MNQIHKSAGTTTDTTRTSIVRRDEEGRWYFAEHPLYCYDIEVYPNLMVVSFFDGVEWYVFTQADLIALKGFVEGKTVVLVGFNNLSYDDPLLRFLTDRPEQRTQDNIYELSRLLVADKKTLDSNDKKWLWDLRDRTGGWHLSIDLRNLVGRRFGSLKEWACHLGNPTVSESPVPFDQPVSPDAMHQVMSYNRNDVLVTEAILAKHQGLLDVRRHMETSLALGKRVYRENEAAIAERFFGTRYSAASGHDLRKLRSIAESNGAKRDNTYPFHSLMPAGVDAESSPYQDLLDVLAGDVISCDHDGSLVRESTLINNQIEIDGVLLTYGCGGLHSYDEPGDFTADAEHHIWDIDVASFYPGLMVANNIRPHNTNVAFTRELAQQRDQRLVYKKDRQVAAADSLKFMINSIGGRLNYEFSMFYDRNAYLQMIATGQILLTLLIEAVSLSGARVLSVNTDGLILQVPIRSGDAVLQAMRRWERAHGLVLEQKQYQRYLRSSGNNYFAIETDVEGRKLSVKTKGGFGDGTKNTSARVIKRAIEHHLTTGGSIRTFIEGHSVAKNFLLFTRGREGTNFSCKGQQVGRTVRWYHGSGPEVGSIRRHAQADDRGSLIPDGKAAIVANELPIGFTRADLPGLDVEAYVRAAEKLLATAHAGPQVDRGTAEARRLQEMGLTLLPQRGHRNPTRVQLDDIETITALQDQRCAIWGVITGRETSTLVLDLDKPEALSDELIAILARCPTLTTWHGSSSAEEVRSGLHRGALVFRYSGDDARIRTVSEKSFTDLHGFEVGFGKKTQTVVGPHRSAGDDYAQDGTPACAPPELINYLALHLKGFNGGRKSTREDEAVSSDAMQLLRQAADSVTHTGWGKVVAGPPHRVEGRTPDKEKASRLWIGLNRGRVWVHSFHANFEERQFQKRVQNEFNKLLDQHPHVMQAPERAMDPADRAEPLTAEEAQTAADCAEAFQRIGRIGLLEAPTGAGKTHQCVLRAFEVHESGGHIVIAAQDKEGICQMQRQLRSLWEERGRALSELMLQIVVSGESNDDGQSSEDTSIAEQGSRSKRSHGVKESTRIVLTHHTYLSRKNLSKELYAIAFWIEEYGAEVIIDEIDLFIDRQNRGTTLDARYRHIGSKSAGIYKAISQCPSHRGIFRCRQCPLRSGTCIEQKTSHREARPEPSIFASRFADLAEEELEIGRDELVFDTVTDLPILNLRLRKLSQTPGFLEARAFPRPKSTEARDGQREEDESKNLSDSEQYRAYLHDLVECSHRPTEVEPRPVDEAGKIVDEDPFLLSQDPPDGNKPTLDSERACKLRFPYFPCGVRTLLLYDRAPLYFIMRHASRVIMMTATISDEQVEFIHACAGPHYLDRLAVPNPTHAPLQRVIVIGHEGRVYWDTQLGVKQAEFVGFDPDPGLTNRTLIERLGNALSKVGRKPLIFLPTKKIAEHIFNQTRERGWSFFIGNKYESHCDLPVTESAKVDGSQALISYARSSIGTGKNLPDYQVVVVDGSVTRPHFLFNPKITTATGYLQAQEEDRLRIMVQNVGRIMRGEGTKIVFVTGISRPQVESLARRLEKLTKEPAQLWTTPDDEVGAVATLVASAAAERLIIKESPREPTKTRSKMSKKQRLLADHGEASADYTVTPEFLKKFDIAVEGHKSDLSKRAIHRMINYNRMSLTERFLLRLAACAAGREPWHD